MSKGHELLQEGREVRLHEERLVALSKPWYRELSLPVWITYILYPAFIILSWVFDPPHNPTIRGFFYAALLLGSIVWMLWNVTRRDRLWRELIRREAPDLHRKLTKLD